MTAFTKICTAKVAIPAMMLTFGIASATTSVAKNFGGLVACRIVVGAFESGFLASVVFYLSKWYTRGEIASRIAIFYSGSVVASAFGGLLAYGMFQLKPSGGLFVWSYLFILEGCLTCIVAIIVYFILPQDIEGAYFLSAEEKDVAAARIQIESMENRNDKWVWSEALSEFRTVHAWARIVIGMAVGILPHTSANFLAIMTQRLGYSVTKTNLVSLNHGPEFATWGTC
jgi:MFS family permease